MPINRDDVSFDIVKLIDGDDLVGHNGVTYSNLSELIQVSVFGFCSCGDSEANLKYVRDGFRHINSLMDQPRDHSSFDEWYAEMKKRGLDLFGNEQPQNFFFYWADKEGYTEHGGCIPGWLTEKGKDLLKALDVVCKEE